MSIVNLEIKDCDKKFADMVSCLHAAYAKGLRFNFDANFTGNPQDFKYFFSKIDANDLYSVVLKTLSKSEISTNE